MSTRTNKYATEANARKALPDPNKTNDGPVAVITLDGVPFRFHLMASGGTNRWVKVNALGRQRCARQSCANTFLIQEPASYSSVNKLYCSHTCRGRASEARRLSTRTAAFNTVDQSARAAKSYVKPLAKISKRLSKSGSCGVAGCTVC